MPRYTKQGKRFELEDTMKSNTLFALILTALFATSSCSAVFSRVNGSHSRPEMAVMVDPQTGRPFVARTGGWINGELHSVSPFEYATVAAADSDADYTRSLAGANWTYAQAISGFNQSVGYSPDGTGELGVRMDEIERNGIVSVCVQAGGTAEACDKDPTSALKSAPSSAPAASSPATSPQEQPTVEPTPQVAPATSASQPQAVAPSAQAPAATAAGGSYYLQFKAAAMLAQEPGQLAAVFGKAALRANSPKARELFEAQAVQIRQMSPAELPAMQSEKQLVTYQPFLNQ